MDVLSPLPLTRAAPCEAGLIQKLLEATAEIAPIPKRGLNAESGYAFAAAEDIVAAVRGPLARHGLVVVCTLKDRVSQAVPGRGWREQVLLTVTVTDGTSALSIDAPGEGQDAGDKAVYKAWTGAFKYALRSLLQLPFGEDPETSPCPGPSPVASPVSVSGRVSRGAPGRISPHLMGPKPARHLRPFRSRRQPMQRSARSRPSEPAPGASAWARRVWRTCWGADSESEVRPISPGPRPARCSTHSSAPMPDGRHDPPFSIEDSSPWRSP